jgi:uncharacterized membrane protein HdeD (DUF308 family)
MAIGLGIVLLVLGLVLVMNAITVDLSFVDDHALGWILVAAGVLAIVISLIVSQQRSRSTVIEERRIR